ncbi:MAG: hypothetical protein LBK50_01030 [Candidatus Nomurabacteria bacterium]|nr:hypothetical protein [Candidatus Nomurabacteria bacterium]
MVGFSIGGSVNSASPSGTSIPVKKGGTGATTPSDAIQNLLPDFASNAGKVLGSTGSGIGWVAQTGGGNSAYMFPDYANQETANRNETNNVAWTVENDGYVYCRMMMTSANASANDAAIYINDKAVARGSANGANPQRVNLFGVYQVSSGDRVRLWYNVGLTQTEQMGCWFIPPKYSTPPTPIVVEGGDYKTAEQAVMVNDGGNLRQKLWVDGKPIYQKTINYTVGNLASGGGVKIGDISLLSSDLDKMVNAEFVSNQSTNVGVVGYFSIHNNNGDLMLWNGWLAASVGVPLTITVQYTKTTDTPL